jgi:ATP-dependent DNA helicase RecG
MSAPVSSRSILPVQFLRGIGPKKGEALRAVGIREVRDLFFHVPRRYLDRTAIVTIAEIRSRPPVPSGPGFFPEGDSDPRRDVTVVGEVRSFRVLGAGRGGRFVLVLADATGSMQCVWFGGLQYWRRAFQIGERLAVSGQPAVYRGTLQIVHPDFDRLSPGEGEIDWEKRLHTGGLVPLYPSGQELSRAGLDSAGFRRAIRAAIDTVLAGMPDLLPEEIRVRRGFADAGDAIRSVHLPKEPGEVAPGLRRLKYEEFFLFQLKLALRRQTAGVEQGISFTVKSPLARKLVDALPFALTRAQKRVINEISSDMSAPRPMHRLLQGDVGSGKTVVALCAVLIAVDNGYQALFMAPTEVLAEQHYRTLTGMLTGLPVSVRLLVGAQRSRLRRDILEDARSGGAQILVGTHALLEEEVQFARLGLVVIDEQHRFGVLQRARIRRKGENPDVLVMTATPIPRTLSMTLYGDLDVSLLDELPPGRKPVATLVKPEGERGEVHRFVREEVNAGRQAYYVYPLIEESEKLALRAATLHFEELRDRVFPDLKVGLLHGRMAAEEKDRILAAFKGREIDILVSTTVIEVGIDVPNATVMVIENAERFGLSQLHQLRGRVGRGAERSTCVLIAPPGVTARAKRGGGGMTAEEFRLAERRLAAMMATNDGFVIAETDLELRGPGDFFGTRQSGMPEFRVGDLLADGSLLEAAREDAFALVAGDPTLERSDCRALSEFLRERFPSELELLRVG